MVKKIILSLLRDDDIRSEIRNVLYPEKIDVTIIEEQSAPYAPSPLDTLSVYSMSKPDRNDSR